MSKKYIIKYDKDGCIGVGACVDVSAKFWKMVGEKAELIGSKLNENDNIYELEIEENDLKEVLESAEVCPVNVIKIINKETKEYIE